MTLYSQLSVLDQTDFQDIHLPSQMTTSETHTLYMRI